MDRFGTVQSAAADCGPRPDEDLTGVVSAAESMLPCTLRICARDCLSQVDPTFVLQILCIFLNKVFKKFQQTEKELAHIHTFIIKARKILKRYVPSTTTPRMSIKVFQKASSHPLRLSRGTHVVYVGYHGLRMYF